MRYLLSLPQLETNSRTRTDLQEMHFKKKSIRYEKIQHET